MILLHLILDETSECSPLSWEMNASGNIPHDNVIMNITAIAPNFWVTMLPMGSGFIMAISVTDLESLTADVSTMSTTP